jgi:hypothetical protein
MNWAGSTAKPVSLPGLEWARCGHSRSVRGLRMCILLAAAAVFWPLFVSLVLDRYLNRWLVDPPLRLNPTSQFLIRGIAYALPFALPVVGSGGREALQGILGLVGSLSVGVVLVLGRPAVREQRLLIILAYFWLIVLILPALVMD